MMTDFREMGNFRSIKVQLIAIIAGVAVATGLLVGGLFFRRFRTIKPSWIIIGQTWRKMLKQA